MPDIQPGGYYSGYLTMANGMSQVQDRMARLNAFLQDQPLQQANMQAQTQGQQLQNQYYPTMMNAKMQGTPWEQMQFEQNQALKRQELEKQYALLNNTLRHQGVTEGLQAAGVQRQQALEQLKIKQAAWKNAMDAYQAGMGPHPSTLPEFQGMGAGGMPQTVGPVSAAPAATGGAPIDASQMPQPGGREVGGIAQNPATLPIPQDLAQLPPGARMKILSARVEERPHANAALNEALANLDRMSDQAKAIAENKDMPWATGLSGTVLRNIPATASKALDAQLTSLKAQTAFATLNQLRSQSKTGGALGQVSNQEENMLANSIAGLDPQQDAESFRRALEQLQRYTKGAKDRLTRAYKATYGVEPDIKDYNTVVGPNEKLGKPASGQIKFLGYE